MTSNKRILSLDKGFSQFTIGRHAMGETFIGRQIGTLAHHLLDIPATGRIGIWAQVFALAAATIGFLGLTGWFGNLPILAQGYPGSVLMAPRAAIVFLCLGVSLFCYLRQPDGEKARSLLLVAGVVSVVVSLMNKKEFPMISAFAESFLSRDLNKWEYIYRNRMPAWNVYTFYLSAPGFLGLPFLRRLPRLIGDFAGTVSLLVLLVYTVILQGYIYSFPILYPQGFKPTSLPSAVAFCALSAAFILTLGVPYFPLRPLSGSSVRARLFRTFLPVGFASIFIYSLLLYTVFRNLNPALTGSCSAIVATVFVTVLVARSSSVVSTQVERAVRETEKQFGVLVQSVEDHSIFMMDPEGFVVTWNAGAERAKGYSAEEVIGKHYSIFFSAEDRAKGKPFIALQQAREHGSYREEGWRVRKGGSLFWADVSLRAIHDESGHLLGFSKVSRDVSDRRRAAEILEKKTSFIRMLQSVTSAANDASTLEEAMGICLALVCRQLGWPVGHGLRLLSDRNELVSASWHLEPGAHLKAFREKTSSVVYPAGSGLPGLVLKSGKPAWVADLNRTIKWPRQEAAKVAGLKMWCAFPILSGPAVVGVLEFFSDIGISPDGDLQEIMVQVGTQLGRVAERQKSDTQMRASLAEKEVLLKEIHHRVKNNLQIISSLLRLQSEHVLDPRMMAIFQESQDRVQSMSLIHQFLYQSDDLAHLQFADYIRSLISSLQTSYGITPEDMKITLEIEPLRLDIDMAIPCGLIVTELASNVLKHAFPVKNKVRDELLIRFQEQASKNYQLTVKDNGVGLPESLEIDRTRSLGLRLVRALTQQLGGQLHVKRMGGTEFSIEFSRT